MDKFFEPADESLLRWRMSVEEEESNIVDDDDNTAEPLLKTVVRTSYLYHLRQSLRKNLESSKQKNVCDIEENMINKVIKGCSGLLEEKALRNCMIARLYQRVMAQTIKEVKKATNDGQLYSPLKEFANRQSTIPITTFCDKEIQTDDMIFPTSTLQTVQNKPEKVSNNGTDKRNLTSHFAEKSKSTKSFNGISDVDGRIMKDENSISSTSAKPSHSLPNQRSTWDECTRHKETPSFNGVEPSKRNFESAETILSKPSIQNVGFRVKQEFEAISDLTMSSVSNKTDSFQLKLKSSNFVECIAYWYNLECELEELPPSKRQKLDEKFSQLFGKDHAIDYYFLTDEQKSITCRKRIAKHVVMELTNYYNQKKITSKQLFKTMAKHITSILLGRSLFPDPGDIKRSVGEFFMDGRIISSEDDFYF